MRIGFVGLGNMGTPMARNLIRAGHAVVVYNRSRSRADALAKEGAVVADSPAEACRQEIVITMLADDNAVESMVLGEHGAVEAMESGATHVSMSTISPELSQRLATLHKQRSQHYVAAPVFGRPEAAAEAKLFIVAAGPAVTLARLKPVFDVLGQRTFELGEVPEHANFVKLFGNFLITCVLESLAEVFAVARKAGVEPKAALDVLTGTLFNAPIYKTYGPRIIEEKFLPAGFKMPLGLKDVRLMLQAAEGLSAPMPFANIVRDRFLTAIANGGAELDWSAIALVTAESAGLSANLGKQSKVA